MGIFHKFATPFLEWLFYVFPFYLKGVALQYSLSLSLLFNVNQILSEFGMPSKGRTLLPLRFQSRGSRNEFTKNVEEFLRETKDITPDPLDGTYHFGQGGLTPWFDHLPEMRNLLLSINFFIFGNSTVVGESSFWYFTQGRSAIKITGLKEDGWEHLSPDWSLNIRDVLKQSFFSIGLPESAVDRIVYLFEKNYDESYENTGRLFQIAIKKNCTDKMVYYAKPGGKIIDTGVIKDAFNPQKKYHSVRKLLEIARRDPFGLDREASKEFYRGTSHAYNYSIDRCQGRMLITSPHLLNPEEVFYNHYVSNPQFKEEEIKKRLKQLLGVIIKGHLKNILLGNCDFMRPDIPSMEGLEEILIPYAKKLDKRERDRLGQALAGLCPNFKTLA